MHGRLNLRHSTFIAAILLLATTGRADPPADDAKTIVGHWQCTQATFKGEPFAEYVGAVYWFKDNGELEIQDNDSWSRWKYRIDTTKTPKRLANSWADGKFRLEIYELSKDRLRTRSADDPQRLSFDEKPKGSWNESVFKRITAEEAQVQIEKLKAQSD